MMGTGVLQEQFSDLLLARSDNSSQRFYSLSNQIQIDRKVYYSILQKTQHKDGEITEWLVWYLNCLLRALENTELMVEKVLYKAGFWDKIKNTELNSSSTIDAKQTS